MVTRNLSMQTYWESVAREWKPRLHFAGSNEAD